MQKLPHLLLVCGLPATGKTTFGDWLRDTHRYIHLDLELNNCLATNNLPQFWRERIWNLDKNELTDFLVYLQRLEVNTVITWAFHTDLIPLVRYLVEGGCQPWWFDGDKSALRTAHYMRKRVIKEGRIQSGEPDMDTYDWYVASLMQHWEKIAPIFGKNSIQTLYADGNRLSCENIWGTILSASVDDSLISTPSPTPRRSV